MPFVSESQRRKMYELHKQGKIKKEQLDEMEKGTPKNLPEKVPGRNKIIIRRPQRLQKWEK